MNDSNAKNVVKELSNWEMKSVQGGSRPNTISECDKKKHKDLITVLKKFDASTFPWATDLQT